MKRMLIALVLVALTAGALATLDRGIPSVSAQALQQVLLHVGTVRSPVALASDTYGAPLVRQDHPQRFRCTVTTSTATTLTAVGGSCAAPGAGLSLYVTDVLFSASASGIAADAFPTLKYGTGGTCGSGTTVFWGTLTAAAIVVQDNRSIPIKLPENNEICWIASTAGSKFLVIGGFIAP